MKFISNPELCREILDFFQHIAAVTWGSMGKRKKGRMEKRSSKHIFIISTDSLEGRAMLGQENFLVFLMRENNIFIEKLLHSRCAAKDEGEEN